MPELPEVEVIRRNVVRLVGGHTLTAVEVPDDEVVRAGRLESLVGLPLTAARRRGKFLLLDFGASHTAIVHFRMTGKLVQVIEGEGRKRRATLTFQGDVALAFVDTRRLGHIDVVERDAVAGFGLLATMGPEPWPVPLGAAALAGRFEGCPNPVKVAMMDQTRVAGVGNILASEACYRAGIDPRLRPARLSLAEWAALAEALCETCEVVVTAEEGGEVQYVNDGGPTEVDYFQVYQRAGRPCRGCGEPIAQLKQAGRATFWCPSCQGGAECRGG